MLKYVDSVPRVYVNPLWSHHVTVRVSRFAWFDFANLSCTFNLTWRSNNPTIRYRSIVFITGNVWVFGNFNDMLVYCPFYVDDWNQDFVNFALLLTILDWIILCCFFYICRIYNVCCLTILDWIVLCLFFTYAVYTICAVDISTEDVDNWQYSYTCKSCLITGILSLFL